MQQTFVAGDPRINPESLLKMLFEACGVFLDSSRKGGGPAGWKWVG
jgi:hypothetical protein